MTDQVAPQSSVAPPDDPPTVDTPPARPSRWVLPAVLSSTVLVIGGVSVVNLATPSMQADLAVGPAEISLVVAAYGLTYAVFLITGGRLGDLYGRRRVMLLGVTVFTVAVAVGGFATSLPWLVATRAVQGLGAALMYPQVLSTIETNFDGARRVRAVSAFGASIGAAIVGGQLLGGAVIDIDPGGLAWRAALFVQVPLGLACLAMCATAMPHDSARTGGRLDGVGTGLLAVALSLFVIPLLLGHNAGWPIALDLCLVAAAPALGLFAWWERRLERAGRTPVLRPSLFGQRSFVVGMGMGLLFYVGTLGFALYTSVTLQAGAGFSPLETGIAFSPAGVAFLAASLSVPRIIATLGRYVLSLGYLLLIAGMGLTALLLQIGPDRLHIWTLLPGFVLVGLGQGFGMAPLIGAVLSGVRPADAGSAAGALTAAFQIGQVVGVAVVGTVYFAALGDVPTRLTHVIGLQDVCFLLMIVGACLFALVFLLPSPVGRTRVDVFLHDVPHRLAGLGYALSHSTGGFAGSAVWDSVIAHHHHRPAAPARPATE